MKFTVYGEPTAKGRPRFTKNGKPYTPEKTTAYENLVKLSFDQQVIEGPIEGEVTAIITAYFAIPKSTSKKKEQQMLLGNICPTKKPDTDNIAKIILDALNGRAYQDDKQVVQLMVKKYYTHMPRVEIELYKRT